MRFFAVIFTILISIVGANFVAPIHSYAQQTTPTSSQTDLEAGIYLFDQEIRTVNTETLITQIGADSVAALTKEIMYAKSIFVALYNNEISSGKTPDTAFKNALNAVQYTVSILGENSKYGDSNLILTSSEKNLLNGSTAKKLLNDFTGILGSAQPSDYKNLSPNTPNLQVTIAQNNTAVTTGAMTSTDAALANASSAAATAKDRNNNLKNSGACFNLTGFNLGACIDNFVSYVIGAVLIPIAGFLVTTTATMMNYAIKIGILDFAKWARI